MIRPPCRGPVGALLLEGLLSRLSFGFLTFTLPLFARHLGLSLTEVGVLVSLNTAVALACKPAMGWLADRWGYKRTLLAGITLRSVVTLLLGLATAPGHLYLARGMHGLSMSLRDPSVHALLAEHGGAKGAGSAFAWYQTSKSLAGSLSKTLAGVLLTLTASNFSLVFGVAFALSFFPALTVARLITDRGAISGPLPEVHSSEEPAQVAPLAEGARRPNLVPFIGLGFLIRATADLLDGLVPIIATEYAGLTPAETGSAYAVATTALVVCGPLFGWLADRAGGGAVLLVRSAANVMSSVLYLIAPTFPGVVSAKTLDDMGKAAFRPAWGALMANVSSFDRRQRARTMSVMTMGEDAGAIVAPVVAGALWAAWGLPVLLISRIALAVLSEIVAIGLTRTEPRQDRRRDRTASSAVASAAVKTSWSDPSEAQRA